MTLFTATDPTPAEEATLKNLSRPTVLSTVAAVVLSLFICVSNSGAAIVTVGSPMTANYTSGEIGASNAVFNTKVPGNSLSPVSGAIIGWNVLGFSGGPFTLRVLQPVGSNEATGEGASAAVTPISTGPQHFSTDVPIKVGQTIAFDHAHSNDHVGFAPALVSGDKLAFFSSPLTEGATAAWLSSTSAEVAFNAEVQPAPVVSALSTTSGPASGGTSVLIAGTDLENATSVTFGGIPVSFSLTSESSIVATSPPSASGGPVAVSVTTLAGSSTAAQAFVYQAPISAVGGSTGGSTGGSAGGSTPAPTPSPSLKPAASCKVPDLTGKKLSAAKSSLAKADCKIGKVKMAKGVTAKTGKVVGQSVKAGARKVAGSKVNIKLG